MIKILLNTRELQIPHNFVKLVKDSMIYDSSSSTAACVFFIEKDQGYFLKTAPKGKLKREFEMTCFFHKKGLAPEVIDYQSLDRDWLLTQRVPGEGANQIEYLRQPKKLINIVVEQLQKLHELHFTEISAINRTDSYIQTVELNYQKGVFNPNFLSSRDLFKTSYDIFDYIQEIKPLLESDTLIHGDFCLPNVILNNWKFQSMIDWDCSGMGDKHIDLFWLLWTFQHQLKTATFKDYILDCYGREAIEMSILEAIPYFEVFG
ncbi:aminoglycoside 3'-phosphotransferase [Streptococcus ictaluri]|uniref:Phosphotransferase enzyme family protein n=1 Tax=Streptococcus ictaluri 707-05 TaxID=764299 RepID=G5K1G0_9STRE|nr:aminoglycoside 3'-phosphotransferase [Streptococcus ictaluri]EHI70209.1 phosphotransferase enzyme family protein [Streptococcus ictaluri 707-05]